MLYNLVKLKNKNRQNIKRLLNSVLNFEGQLHLYLSVYLYFYAIVLFMTIINIDLYTSVTK